jgi:hypothetical protein
VRNFALSADLLSPRPPRHDPSHAGSVFAGFLIVGGIALYSAEQATRPPERAVPGSPSGGGPRAEAGAPELPPEHPPIALPEEAVKFLDELAAEAKAAPDSLDAWQRLARGRYRAALIAEVQAEPRARSSHAPRSATSRR